MHIAHLPRTNNELLASPLEDKLCFVFRDHVRGAVVLLRQLFLPPQDFAGEAVLRISAGSLLAPCGAAALMDSNVNAGAGGDDACETRLCVAASATAKGKDTMRRAAIGVTLIFRQLCCPLCVPVSCFFRQGHALIAVRPRGEPRNGGPGLRASPRKRNPALEYELIRALDQPFRSLTNPRSIRLRLPAQVTIRWSRCGATSGRGN
jgi:hypothetical protein